MTDTLRRKFAEYYVECKIHPQHFACPHQDFCRQFAHRRDMTETKMSMVGRHYGEHFPRIVVLSLDPPSGNRGAYVEPHQRTTECISERHENDDYSATRPNNPHWAMTQIIVKDILCWFGYVAQPGVAVVKESYAGRPIENVSAFFAHVNVAKCSMNNPGKGQAHRKVHVKCADSYLAGELKILAPDILITQGNAANEITARLLNAERFSPSDLPCARKIDLEGKTTLWLPMRHPARQLANIRLEWPQYVAAIHEYAINNRLGNMFDLTTLVW